MKPFLDIKKKVGIIKEIYIIMPNQGAKAKKSFTLLELIVVIIIIGILATLGFTQYTRVIERGRTAEAKAILGQMRTAQEVYMLENGVRTAVIGDLAVAVPVAPCVTTHYFTYTTTTTLGTATRCGTGTGKTPGAATTYTITLNYAAGVWGGTAGYY